MEPSVLYSSCLDKGKQVNVLKSKGWCKWFQHSKRRPWFNRHSIVIQSLNELWFYQFNQQQINEKRYLILRGSSSGSEDLSWVGGPSHVAQGSMCFHPVNRIWTHVARTTCECGLAQCVHTCVQGCPLVIGSTEPHVNTRCVQGLCIISKIIKLSELNASDTQQPYVQRLLQRDFLSEWRIGPLLPRPPVTRTICRRSSGPALKYQGRETAPVSLTDLCEATIQILLPGVSRKAHVCTQRKATSKWQHIPILIHRHTWGRQIDGELLWQVQLCL